MTFKTLPNGSRQFEDGTIMLKNGLIVKPDKTDTPATQDVANGDVIPRFDATGTSIPIGGIIPPPPIISDQNPLVITQPSNPNPLLNVPTNLPVNTAPVINTGTMGASIAGAQQASLTTPSPSDFNPGAGYYSAGLRTPVNTAAPVVTASSFLSKKNLPYIIGGAVLFMVVIVFVVLHRKK